MRLLNTELISNPLNWATVALMCLFAAVLLALIFPEAVSGS
jgi:hypothetical protein